MKTWSYHVEAKKKFLAKNNFAYSNSFHKLYYTKQATLALKDMKTWSYHVEAKRNFLAKDNLAYSNGFHKPCYTKQATLAPKRWVYEADSETDNDSDA